MKAIAPVLILFAAPAAAGCANFTDGSMAGPPPRYEICYDTACDVTTLDFECSNARGGQAGWTIGWERHCTADGCTWFWQGREIAPDRAARITVKPVD